ncbi:MAG: hypothetical protein A2Z20_08485 [Bdellovibrionales bacterium RBG_16_40_8]|nr:MAG: hypothetical protein A2Z20_08485 [Bdellovibrionales bacterium RBG_16_40_8]
MSKAISEALSNGLKPTHLEVIDESFDHMAAATAKSPETHFKVIIVSDAFKGLAKVKRQQLVFGHIKDLFDKGLHAFIQSTFTPEEWHECPQVISSPVCGHKKIQRSSS